jgi:UDP-N-acetylglucosamine--N-acetylmuramyl-(pentapeptide) pyrophosphoryl-undecaprenol N-acetylglucosamine transferase
MAKRILLVGGGSGGHAYPLVAVAEALREEAKSKNTSLELLILGEGGFVERAAQEHQIPFKRIVAGKLRRYLSPLLFLDLIKLPVSFAQSLWHLFWYMPDLVFSKGGYDSVMPGIVAWLYRIPLYIHESDMARGLANRITARFATKVFVAFAAAEKDFKPGKALFVGNPTRKEILLGDRQAALAYFNFSSERKTILVIGGSQGAKEINDIILESLAMLTKDYQVIHQCGETQYQNVKKVVDQEQKEGKEGYGSAIEKNYRVYAFFDSQQMAKAYAACDVVISRAGAGSLFEIAMVGKPAIVIPLVGGSRGEQPKNAAEFAKVGAVVLEGANLTPHLILNQIENLLEPQKYAEVSQKIKQFATPDAAAKIASALLL